MKYIKRCQIWKQDPLTVSHGVQIKLSLYSASVISRKRTTYGPEQPPFHLMYWDEIASRENKARDEECTQAEGSVV